MIHLCASSRRWSPRIKRSERIRRERKKNKIGEINILEWIDENRIFLESSTILQFSFIKSWIEKYFMKFDSNKLNQIQSKQEEEEKLWFFLLWFWLVNPVLKRILISLRQSKELLEKKTKKNIVFSKNKTFVFGKVMAKQWFYETD